MKKNIRKGQHFTFQYGSTLIPIYWLAFKDNSFTFQYGSTLMLFNFCSTVLIVPLHSNMVLL